MTDSHPMLTKIRKLLTLAENPAATAAEAEAFTAKATQLMADYGIDQALLADPSGRQRAITDRVLGFDAPYARDKCALATTIAVRHRCQAVTIQRGSSVSLHVFGLETDVTCVEILLTSLLLQGTRDLSRTPIPWGEHVAAYRRSWWAGFAIAIARRLRQAERQSVQEAQQRQDSGGRSVALVLANASHEVEAAMHQTYPRLGIATPRRLSGGGGRDGYASGQRADLDPDAGLTGASRGRLGR